MKNLIENNGSVSEPIEPILNIYIDGIITHTGYNGYWDVDTRGDDFNAVSSGEGYTNHTVRVEYDGDGKLSVSDDLTGDKFTIQNVSGVNYVIGHLDAYSREAPVVITVSSSSTNNYLAKSEYFVVRVSD